jgi:hypothetical protein
MRINRPWFENLRRKLERYGLSHARSMSDVQPWR